MKFKDTSLLFKICFVLCSVWFGLCLLAGASIIWNAGGFWGGVAWIDNTDATFLLHVIQVVAYIAIIALFTIVGFCGVFVISLVGFLLNLILKVFKEEGFDDEL